MKIKNLTIVTLFFLTSHVMAETPPDNRQCVRYDWKELNLKLTDKTISPHWRDVCGDSMAVLHMYYGSAETALNYIQREIELKPPISELESAFYTAIVGNFQSITRVLLDYGLPPEPFGKNGYSPLMRVAAVGNLEIMRMLIKAGADINYGSPTQDVLSNAVEHGHIYAVNLLLEHGANVEQYKSNVHQSYLLKLAVKNGNYDLVVLLMKLGFELNIPDQDGDTILLYAIENRLKYDMIDFLLQKGADPCIKNAKGEDAKMVFDRLKQQPKFDPYTESNYVNLLDNLCAK